MNGWPGWLFFRLPTYLPTYLSCVQDPLEMKSAKENFADAAVGACQ